MIIGEPVGYHHPPEDVTARYVILMGGLLIS